MWPGLVGKNNLYTLTGSAADNWARLEDRMRFILDMFRSHQQSYSLFNAPFEAAQTAEIGAGLVPVVTG